MAFRPDSIQIPDTAENNPKKAARGTYSLPGSQSSSFNDSMTSQQSNARAYASTNVDSSENDPLARAATPATSISNASSQDHAMIYDDTPIFLPEKGGSKAPTATMQGSSPTNRAAQSSHSRQEHTSAPKRMANGEIKSSYSSVSASPTELASSAHSRNSSTHSRSSEVLELSRKLKTGLAYAMTKVQNGWEDHNISELEQMASQRGSPASAHSAHSKTWAGSPRNDARYPYSPQTTTSTTGNISAQVSPQSAYSYQRSPQKHVGHTLNVTTSSQSALTYESFWRERENHGAKPRLPASQGDPAVAPTLAPPIDISSRSPQGRPSKQIKAPPPRLQTNTAPTTPQRPLTASIRTPAQEREDEKDAAETLMFLASPNNSGSYPGNSTLRTPIGTPACPPTQIRTPVTSRGKATATTSTGAPTRARPSLTDMEIDQRLDEMGTDSSDSDLEDLRAHKAILERRS